MITTSFVCGSTETHTHWLEAGLSVNQRHTILLVEDGNAPSGPTVGPASTRPSALPDEPCSFVNTPNPLARLLRLLHDLGNPLTAIATNVEFLNDLVGDFSALPPNQVALMREVLQEIGQSADRMRDITRALRDVAAPASDRAAASEMRDLAKAQPRDPREAIRNVIGSDIK